MNKENAKDYLPLVQALAEGKTIQVKKYHQEIIHGFGNRPVVVRTYSINEWEITFEIDTSKHPSDYRIKPELKKAWYRVGLIIDDTGDWTVTAQNDSDEKEIPNSFGFIRWLTDRIEYELPEGDA